MKWKKDDAWFRTYAISRGLDTTSDFLLLWQELTHKAMMENKMAVVNCQNRSPRGNFMYNCSLCPRIWLSWRWKHKNASLWLTLTLMHRGIDVNLIDIYIGRSTIIYTFDLWTSPSSVSPTPRSLRVFSRLWRSPLLCFLQGQGKSD